jgi:transglutaminase-like putative cysteine protease
MIDNFTYDYDKAATVVSGYLPVVNDVYKANTGICFDYAAVMATMLRSQRIPTRLEVGYMGEEYHAWISVYIQDMGWVNGIIEFDGTNWNLMDPTFASTSKSPKDYITKNSKYLTKYVY